MNKLTEAKKIIDLVRVKSDKALLFCSLGKDSLVLLELMYPKFKKIVCVFMYFVKDLDHINRYINWVKIKYPNVEFIQVPHWNLTYLLRSGLYCVPNSKVKLLKLKDIEQAMRLKYDCYYTFYGMKKADGMNRRLMLNTYTNGENNGKVYPLQDWTQKDILAYMRQNKIPMPIRYSSKASGGVGFNLECYLWMRENAPKDLEKVLKVFPMSGKILFDYDNKEK